MNNGVYGSPFPKLNPNMRYKTVFERAGFEIYTGDSPQPHSHSNYHHHHHHRPHHIPVTKPRSSSSSSAMPLPNQGDLTMLTSGDGGKVRGTRERVMSSPIKNTHYMSQVRSDREQERKRNNYPYKEATGYRNPPVSSDSTIYLTKRTSGGDCFGKDRQSSNRSNRSSNGSNGSEFSNNSAVHRHRFDGNNSDNISLSQSPSPSPSPSRSTAVSEFSYTPSQNQSSSRISSTEASNNNNNSKTDSISQHQKSVSKGFVTSQSLRLEDTQARSSAPMSPITPTGASVEQLLAQLDKVSFSRNEKISETLQGASAGAGAGAMNRGLSPESPENPQCVSTKQPSQSPISPVSPPSSLSPTSNRPNLDPVSTRKPGLAAKSNGNEISYKKSSAYLSGFPQLPDTTSPLALQPQISEQSQLLPETPIFYNFQKTGTGFPGPNGEPIETPKIANQDTARGPQFKYPPGEGPCRLCGEKIVGKGIFSKKQNELSGQWHRQCFKCCKCDTVFNRHIPCYILDDNPYCQQHYHETNHSICGVCKRWIEGGCLENDNGERFHIDCLKCFVCKSEIYGDYFIFNDAVPLCSRHDIEALVESGVIGQEELGGVSGESALSKRRTKLIELA